MNVSQDLAQCARIILLQRLESLSRAGVKQLGRVPPQQPSVGVAAERSAPQPVVSDKKEEASVPRRSAALPDEDRETRLAVIRREVAACERCPELAGSRTQTVFGVGNVAAPTVLHGRSAGGG